MTAGQEDAAAPQIIVIRRSGGSHDEGHHGGAWKIAYADFMTAMMAFFLVMWLVNAANRDTKRMVASYFNPLKLTESIAAPKGLKKLQPGEASGAKQETASKEEKSSSDIPTQKKNVGEKTDDSHLSDSANPGRPNLSGLGGDPSKSANVESGQAFLDPFGIARTVDNDRPTQSTKSPGRKPTPDGPQKTKSPEVAKRDSPLPVTETKTSGKPAINVANANKTAVTPPRAQQSSAPSWQPKIINKSGKEISPKSKNASGEKAVLIRKESIAANKKAIEAALALMTKRRGGPSISVIARDDGLLISLMDNENYGMFNTASAKPNTRFSNFISKMSNVLKKYKGEIVISGHTDARPYRTQAYNNWRLSFDRAHEVFQMLTSSGIAADRFKRVEGHAASQLRDRKNPNAANNRRVEIFIRADTE